VPPIKKAPLPKQRGFFLTLCRSKRLQSYDILGLRTFQALSNREIDALTLSESLEAASDDLLEVGKYIGT
jgi:hypothetical protein